MNSQLMKAIRQKVELSQQLDEWKSDVENLLESRFGPAKSSGKEFKNVHEYGTN